MWASLAGIPGLAQKKKKKKKRKEREEYTLRTDPHIIIKKVIRSSFREKNKDKLMHPQLFKK